MAKPARNERAGALTPGGEATNADGSVEVLTEATAAVNPVPAPTEAAPAPTGIGAEIAQAAAAATPTTQTRAPASNFLSIVSGRLPLVFVHRVRFGETAGTNELAKTFGTSVGKIFDIKKNRNFGYIQADWMPTQADIDAAKAWVDALTKPNKHGLTPAGNAEHLTKVIEEYVARGLASPEQSAKQDALRARSKPGGSGSTAPAATTTVAATPAPAPVSAPADAASLLG